MRRESEKMLTRLSPIHWRSPPFSSDPWAARRPLSARVSQFDNDPSFSPATILLALRIYTDDSPCQNRLIRLPGKGQFHEFDDTFHLLVDGVLPHANHKPPASLQFQRLVVVSLHVFDELGCPERAIGRWSYIVVGASVPEAPVNEYCNAPTREDNIRFPYMGFCMETISMPP